MAQLPGIRHPAQIIFNFKTRRVMGKDFHMQYTNYDFLTVSEAADLLETKDTYVYTLIRKGLLAPATTSPQIKLSYPSIVAYVRKRIPSSFRIALEGVSA